MQSSEDRACTLSSEDGSAQHSEPFCLTTDEVISWVALFEPSSRLFLNLIIVCCRDWC